MVNVKRLPCWWWVYDECRKFATLEGCCSKHHNVIHIDHDAKGYTLNGYWYKFR